MACFTGSPMYLSLDKQNSHNDIHSIMKKSLYVHICRVCKKSWIESLYPLIELELQKGKGEEEMKGRAGEGGGKQSGYLAEIRIIRRIFG